MLEESIKEGGGEQKGSHPPLLGQKRGGSQKSLLRRASSSLTEDSPNTVRIEKLGVASELIIKEKLQQPWPLTVTELARDFGDLDEIIKQLREARAARRSGSCA